MIATKKDLLQRPIDLVRKALAEEPKGNERDWLAHMGQSLSDLTSAMREHVCAAEASNGALTTIANPEQDTVATLDRQVKQLRQEHVELLDNAGELKLYVEGIRDRLLANVADEHDVIDIPLIQEVAEDLLDQLHEHEELETKLLVEVYSRDTGVGD